MITKENNFWNKPLSILIFLAILLMLVIPMINSFLANWGNVHIVKAILENKELDYSFFETVNGNSNFIPDNRFFLGTYYLDIGEYKKAIKIFSSMVHIIQRSNIVFYQLGNAYWGNDEKRRAREAWETAGVLRLLAERKLIQGIRLYNQGKQEEAINLYEEAIDVDPSFGKGWYFLGSFYYGDRTQWPLVKVMLSNAIKTGKLEQSEEFMAESRLSIIQGDFEMASKYLEQFVNLNPENAEGHESYAWVLYKIGNIDAAVKEYTITLSLEPKNKWALVDLGRIYFDQGEYDLAIPFFEKALLVDSTYGSAKEWLNRANSEVNKIK